MIHQCHLHKLSLFILFLVIRSSFTLQHKSEIITLGIYLKGYNTGLHRIHYNGYAQFLDCCKTLYDEIRDSVYVKMCIQHFVFSNIYTILRLRSVRVEFIIDCVEQWVWSLTTTFTGEVIKIQRPYHYTSQTFRFGKVHLY